MSRCGRGRDVAGYHSDQRRVDARWSRGGREIIYVAPDYRMMAVAAQTTLDLV